MSEVQVVASKSNMIQTFIATFTGMIVGIPVTVALVSPMVHAEMTNPNNNTTAVAPVTTTQNTGLMANSCTEPTTEDGEVVTTVAAGAGHGKVAVAWKPFTGFTSGISGSFNNTSTTNTTNVTTNNNTNTYNETKTWNYKSGNTGSYNDSHNIDVKVKISDSLNPNSGNTTNTTNNTTTNTTTTQNSNNQANGNAVNSGNQDNDTTTVVTNSGNQQNGNAVNSNNQDNDTAVVTAILPFL